MLQAGAELCSERLDMLVLSTFATVQAFYDLLIQLALSLVMRTDSIGNTRHQVLLRGRWGQAGHAPILPREFCTHWPSSAVSVADITSSAPP
ncbi:hypothetical protein AU476_21300 [Cupriavidus sp. UYMSc13B]|nr:hypothetical protein AU476_21300 [Cupriavidus sp. UYMSc13B]